MANEFVARNGLISLSTVTTSYGGINIGSTTTSIASDGTAIYIKSGGSTYLNTANSAHVSTAGVFTGTGFSGPGTSLTGNYGGTITLTQVINGLGFTPYNSTNPSGYTTNTGTVTGVSGTAPVVSSGGTAPTISMAAASTSVNGYLTSTDWNTFNGKQAALGFTPYNSTNPSGYTTNTGTVTGVSGTAPVVSSGGTAPTISMAAASTSVNGYLTSTDWNTFNGKQAALGFTPYNSTNPSGYISLTSTITGYVVSTNTALAATDTVLGAFNKIQGQINARVTSSGSVSFASISNISTSSTYSKWVHYLPNRTDAVDYPVLWGNTQGSDSNASGAAVTYAFSCAAVKINSSTGTLTATTLRATNDVVAYYSSDRRFKDNIVVIPNALEKIKKVGGYEFDWNDVQSTHKGHDIGVIAQEIEEILPEIVTTREDGYKSVKYEKLVALLIEGMKDQQKLIENQQKQIDSLLNK